MFIDVTAQDIREANDRMDGIRKIYARNDHHNHHNPIAVALERISGCTATVTLSAIHLYGKDVDEIVPLSNAGKNFLKNFTAGNASAVQRLAVT